MFSNGILRATVRSNEDRNVTAILMRTNLATASGYLLYGAPQSDSPVAQNAMNFTKFIGGAETDLGQSESDTYHVGEDWVFELGTVGDQISAKFWKLGDPEPAEPQFTVTDDSLSSGFIYVDGHANHSQYRTEAAQVNATFDDIYFTPKVDLQVPLDIKPGSYPNSINLRSKGVLPVAIVSTEEFDALTVDVDSILFGDLSQLTHGGKRIAPGPMHRVCH